MELWIPITIAAAFLQNLRSAFQKHLKGVLSTGGATFSRFIFALPFALLYAGILWRLHQGEAPVFGAAFFLYAALGGLAQILATALLVALFSHRNFAVGTAYSKTETVQTAFIGVILLGDAISAQAAIGILVSLCGVIALSAGQTGFNRGLVKDLIGRSALMGLASGACFGVAAVSVRGASLSLGGDGFLTQAATSLAAVLIFQTAAMAIWLRWKEPGQIMATVRAWRLALPAGISGWAASVGWFTAMTIQNAAYVRALGQVELVFTFLASWFLFKEKSQPVEIVGVGLICLGVVLLVLES